MDRERGARTRARSTVSASLLMDHETKNVMTSLGDKSSAVYTSDQLKHRHDDDIEQRIGKKHETAPAVIGNLQYFLAQGLSQYSDARKVRLYKAYANQFATILEVEGIVKQSRSKRTGCPLSP